MPDDSRVVPTPAAPDRPSRTILVNGNSLPESYRVLSVKVSHAAHRIPEAEIMLLDGDVSSETFEASNAQELMPGVEIQIKAGYHGQEETIFKGIVIKQAIKVLQGQSSVITATAKHAVFKANKRSIQAFKDKKDSEVIETLLTVDKEVDATTVVHKHLLQSNCSDWDFINIRAEANGLFVLPRYDKILVKKPVLDASPTLNLYYGTSILEFEAEMDARNCVSEVKASGWSAADQKVIESTSSNEWNGKEPGNFTANDAANALGNSSLGLFWQGDTSMENLDAVAKSAMLRHHLSKIVGRVQCIGFATIWPGDIVELHGVGDRYIGKAFVTGVHHSIREGKWDTDIQFGYKNKPYTAQFKDITEKPGLGYVPGIQGLQIGIVTKLEDDPLSETRMLVSLPTQTGGDEAIWARVATLDAGKERGTFFRPEVGDEVIVGFIDNNPLQAVVLGGLHSSKNTSPVEPTADNYTKGFYSKKGLKWQFDDDKKEILLETSTGSRILISEDKKGITLEDENGNKIVMDNNGIEITSSKDFKVKATGDIKLEGTNIDIKANAQFKGSGSAGTEVSSSAITNIKGSMVNIN